MASMKKDLRKTNFDAYLDQIFSQGYRMTFSCKGEVDCLNITTKRGEVVETYEKKKSDSSWTKTSADSGFNPVEEEQ